jgi:Protein of unknown function (DUF3344)
LPQRVNVVQHGDFLLVGNTVGRDCASGVPLPIVGDIGDCGTNRTDSGIDAFWRSDSPQPGKATASSAITVASARSTAFLSIPAGATVTYARLYWAAVSSGTTADDTITFEAPGAASTALQADAAYTFLSSGVTFYQSTRDITNIVLASGSGAYNVSGIDSPEVANLDDFNVFMAWSMVVFYEDSSLPLRQLAIYHGLDRVYTGGSSTTTLSGFLVPSGTTTAKLGVVAYEGDATNASDSLWFEGQPLSDAQNPSGNFFNATRSYLGAPVSVAGDLPQLSGSSRSMSGVEMDVVDVAPRLLAGATSATVEGRSTAERYFLGYYVTSIDTLPIVVVDAGADGAADDGAAGSGGAGGAAGSGGTAGSGGATGSGGGAGAAGSGGATGSGGGAGAAGSGGGTGAAGAGGGFGSGGAAGGGGDPDASTSEDAASSDGNSGDDAPFTSVDGSASDAVASDAPISDASSTNDASSSDGATSPDGALDATASADAARDGSASNDGSHDASGGGFDAAHDGAGGTTSLDGAVLDGHFADARSDGHSDRADSGDAGEKIAGGSASDVVESGGCSCSTERRTNLSPAFAAGVAAACSLVVRRRRRRSSHGL